MMRFLLIVSIGILVASCGQQNSWSTFEKYLDAQESVSFEFEDGIAFQRIYLVNRKYPYHGVIDHYEKVIGEPWTSCNPKNSWMDYLDYSGKEHVRIHQIVRYWANYKANRLLLLSVRYISNIDNKNKVLTAPDNDRQSIILVEYIEPELASSLDRLKLDCSDNLTVGE